MTLTYDEDHLPGNGQLEPNALQRFVKRLRQSAARGRGDIRRDASHSLRYFSCGEYGTQQQRPHYHLLLFNCAFGDQYKVGERLYESPTLNPLWPYGSNRIGELTAASANYVAQYSLKKQRPQDYGAYKVLVVNDDGEYHYSTRYRVQPPFLRMSTRPAIGLRWLERYRQDLAPGYLVENGRQQTIPRYYRKKIKESEAGLHETLDYNLAQHRYRNPNDRDLTAAEKIHQRLKYLGENRTKL